MLALHLASKEAARIETARRYEAWAAPHRARVKELTATGEAIRGRLAEREATFKRRTDLGGYDPLTKQEIARLREELDANRAALDAAEETIAKGPPPAPGTLAARQYAWLAAQRARAKELAAKLAVTRKRLAEREATYKRRVDLGGYDPLTKDEIEQLRAEVTYTRFRPA